MKKPNEVNGDVYHATEDKMIVHSEEAWQVASNFSYALASSTRDLAYLIDDLVNEELDDAAKIAYSFNTSDNPMTANDVGDEIIAMKHVRTDHDPSSG